MEERAELVKLLDTLEEVKKIVCDAQGEERKFLIWLQDKAEKIQNMEHEKCVVAINEIYK